MGLKSVVNSVASSRNYISCNGGQSNNSGPGLYSQYNSQFQIIIPNTFIWYNNSMSPLQIGVNNKNDPSNNKGGYELTCTYALQDLTGKKIFVAKRDVGGTQLYNDNGSSSNTSITMGTGAKFPIGGTGLTYSNGNRMIIERQSDSNTWMKGTLATYDSATGQFQINVDQVNGSGTYNDWTVKLMTWNVIQINQFTYEWLNNYIYPTIYYLFQNNIDFNPVIMWIHGEEDGRDTTKANAYFQNLYNLYLFINQSIYNYVYTLSPGYILPPVSWVISEPIAPSSGNGDTIRSAMVSLSNMFPATVKVIVTAGTPTYDGTHITSAGFETLGPVGANYITQFW